jgi:hypothetical protein
MAKKSSYPISLLSLKARLKSDRLLSLLVKFVRFAPWFFRGISTIYEHAAFNQWLKATSPHRRHSVYQHFSSRNDLWCFMAAYLKAKPYTHIFEFGVANGDGARFWLDALENIEYHGFDCFTGMPEQYRHIPARVFDLGGNPPPIRDSRVHWHVGLVQTTLKEFAFPNAESRLFLFDLDLYGPTLFALSVLLPNMRSGDLIYFDEAFDNAEGVVARHFFETTTEAQIFGSATGCMAVVIP